jgi:hypothetical protein
MSNLVLRLGKSPFSSSSSSRYHQGHYESGGADSYPGCPLRQSERVHFMTTKDTSITVSQYILRIPPKIFTSDSNEDTDWIPSAATPIESGDVDGYDGPTWS